MIGIDSPVGGSTSSPAFDAYMDQLPVVPELSFRDIVGICNLSAPFVEDKGLVHPWPTARRD
jgi:hypothetical protein